MIVLATEAAPPLGLARYGALFGVPHVRRLVLGGLLARLPTGMVALALLLLVRESGGGYAAAGAVSAAFFVATAIGAPVAGRLVDRRGQTQILLPRAIVFPALLFGVCALALLDAPAAAIAVCAAAAGALIPPVGASLRGCGRHSSSTPGGARPHTPSSRRCRSSSSSWAGLPIAPAVMAAYALIDSVALRGTAAEAFAWISTAVSIGLAAGTAAGGALIDAVGVSASFAFGCGAVLAGAVLVVVGPGLDAD